MALGKGKAAVPMRYMNEARESQGSREMEWKRGENVVKLLRLEMLVRLSRDLLSFVDLPSSSFLPFHHHFHHRL